MQRRDFMINVAGVSGSLGSVAAPVKAGPAPEASKPDPGHIDLSDVSTIDPRLDCRSIGFENPTGARGSGGKSRQGRKGRPFYVLDPGEKVTLAEIHGPGTIRHIWATLYGMPPEVSRALRLEVFYDGLAHPSISVPIFDFFGLPHGRSAAFYSALIATSEGRGMNSYMPMPFARSVRVEFTNESSLPVSLFYQIDYTLERTGLHSPSYLHASFRRDNPTRLRQDFIIVDGLKGPGRFLGCSVGIRVLDEQHWYGEGEVKIYRDGDEENPTYCGTGLEDYVGSAYGLGRHYGLYAGSPLNVSIPNGAALAPYPSYISFYRWHVLDPIMFSEDLRVTIQQIGGSTDFTTGQEAQLEEYKREHTAAGPGWMPGLSEGSISSALIERQDDYCATGFVYCERPQEIRPYALQTAIADLAFTVEEAKSQPAYSQKEVDVIRKLKAYWDR